MIRSVFRDDFVMRGDTEQLLCFLLENALEVAMLPLFEKSLQTYENVIKAKLPGHLESLIKEDRADDGLQSIRQRGIFVAPATRLLPAAHEEEIADLEFARHHR